MSGRIDLIGVDGLIFATVDHKLETDKAMRMITFEPPDYIDPETNDMSWYIDEVEVVQLHTPVSWIDTLLFCVDKKAYENN